MSWVTFALIFYCPF